MSCSIKAFLERRIDVRIVVCLGVHGKLRVLKVRIVMRVFLQMCMDFLETKYV